MKTSSVQSEMGRSRNEARERPSQKSRSPTIGCESPSSPVFAVRICIKCPVVLSLSWSESAAVTRFHPSSMSRLLPRAISASLFLSVWETITFFQLAGCGVNGSRNKSHRGHFGGSSSMRGHRQLPLATSAVCEGSAGWGCCRTESKWQAWILA